MSIVRIGLAETKKFAQGYDAIFGAKDQGAKKKAAKTAKKTARPKKKGKKK